jgi:drug/metabolite transporter (DMT)-like permease
MGWSGSVLLKATISASCGSLASVFGKLAFDDVFLENYGLNNLLIKGVLICFIISFNSIMLSLYVRVLQAVSALQASLLAFVCNYVVSSAFGVFVFGERLSVQWIVGAMLMTLGAIRVSQSAIEDSRTRKKKN